MSRGVDGWKEVGLDLSFSWQGDILWSLLLLWLFLNNRFLDLLHRWECVWLRRDLLGRTSGLFVGRWGLR